MVMRWQGPLALRSRPCRVARFPPPGWKARPLPMHEPFSLLVSVDEGDRPDYIRPAVRSAVDDQTVRPDQVIIVRDGPVRDEIARCLDELRQSSPVPVTYVPLPRNCGLGPALDQGLAASWFDVVARMDADDVAMPHRFEVELPLIEDADIVGAGLLEFVGDTDGSGGQRLPPTDAGQIQRYARMHDPFNHPTVVYRRHAVLEAGGYGEFPLMEDYALFARMLAGGARAVNVAEPLVFYRVGPEAFKRRGGNGGLGPEVRDAGGGPPRGHGGRAARVLPCRPRGLQAAGRNRAAALRAAAAARVPAAGF